MHIKALDCFVVIGVHSLWTHNISIWVFNTQDEAVKFCDYMNTSRPESKYNWRKGGFCDMELD